MRKWSTLAGSLIVAIAVPGSASKPKSPNAEILSLVQAFSDARSSFDARTLDALLTPDYVEVSPRGEVDRRREVLGFYSADKATPVPPMTLSTQDVRRFGNIAIVIGSVDYAVRAPTGQTIKRTVRVTYVERRLRGRWLMASTQYTGVPAVQS